MQELIIIGKPLVLMVVWQNIKSILDRNLIKMFYHSLDRAVAKCEAEMLLSCLVSVNTWSEPNNA